MTNIFDLTTQRGAATGKNWYVFNEELALCPEVVEYVLGSTPKNIRVEVSITPLLQGKEIWVNMNTLEEFGCSHKEWGFQVGVLPPLAARGMFDLAAKTAFKLLEGKRGWQPLYLFIQEIP